MRVPVTKSIAFCALLLAALLIACGGGGDPATPADSASTSGQAGQSSTSTSQDSGSASQAGTQPSTESGDDTFRVGVMESLTGPGETYGTVSWQAKQMAADEINAAGGINGKMLELIAEDSKCAAQDAITAYN